MGAIATILFVSAGIVTASRFEQIFLELGLQLPHRTLWVLNPIFHVAVGMLLLGVCAWFLSNVWRARAIGAWLVALLIYWAFVTAGLFLPVIVTVETIEAP